MQRLTACTVLASLAVWIAGAPADAGSLVFEYLKVADTNTVVPGTPDFFSGFGDPAVDDDGHVAFHADRQNAAGELIEGTYAFVNGTLIRILDEASPAPGAGTTIDDLDDHVEIRDGIALSVGEKINTDNDTLHLSDGTTGRTIAEENVTVLPSAGSPVITSIKDTEGFGFDGTRVAFTAEYAGGEGIYLDDGSGSLTKVVDTNDTAPNGEAFTEFENVMPDANGDGIVFFGSTASGDGVYVSENGVITKIGDTITDFPPLSADVDSIRLTAPDIDGGQVVFGMLQRDFDLRPDPTVVDEILLYDGTDLQTIVDLNTVLSTDVKATNFLEMAIAGEDIAFNAITFNSATGERGKGVFIWSEGVIHTVLFEGDELDGRIVTNILTLNRPFFAEGYLAMALEFSDGSKAVYRVSYGDGDGTAVIPTPTAALGGLLGLGALALGRRRGSACHTKTTLLNS